MDSMPPGGLGAVILASFVLVFAIRGFLEDRFLLSAPHADRPRREFFFDFFVTLLAGVIAYGFNHLFYGAPLLVGFRLMTGVAAAGFFIALDMSLARERVVMEHAMSFGGAVELRKSFKPMARTFAVVALAMAFCTILVLGMVLAKNVEWLLSVKASSQHADLHAGRAVLLELLYVLVALLVFVANIIISFSRNLALMFQNQLNVLNRVSRGDFSAMVPVTTANEFGVIAAHTNQMIAGLKHRLNLMGALKLAEEVQRNLLPEKPPDIPGLDIAAISLYSEETGGDYYDFIMMSEGSMVTVVGDVSGHGVASALLMASARASLRMASGQDTDIADIVTRVNSRLSRDTSRSGNFLTLFLLDIDMDRRQLSWVRAGHDPALLYDPVSDSFAELDGPGPALGLDENVGFEYSAKSGWTPGSILIIGTDGIWETHDQDRRMFGKERLREIVRAGRDQSSGVIVDQVLSELTRFRGEAGQEDDVTLVVIRLEK